MSESHATAYRELRLRVSDVIRETDASAFDAPAPATPGWRAHDVVAHLVGVPDDVVNGRMDGLASDPWTQAQVDKRVAYRSLTCWASGTRPVRPSRRCSSAAPAEIAGQALFDAAAHEHDVRHAIGSARCARE